MSTGTKVFGLISGFFLLWLVGCTGPAGPTGPSGSTGSPGSTYYQATFQDGVYPNSSYAGEVDTWLNGGSPGTATNAAPYLEVNTGATYSNYGRILVKFDVSSLPANATVTDAEVWLKLNSATSIGSAPVTIGVHNLASDTFSGCHWTGGADWFSPGLGSWNTCTGDSSNQQLGYINTTTIATLALSNTVNGTSAFYRWDIGSAVVQSWLSNATNNNGLIFISQGEFGEGSSSVDFYPYNDATAANHAVLIVRYQ